MIPRHTRGRLKVLAPLLLVIAALVAIPVTTTSNVVQATKAVDNSRAQGANDVKPAACNALTLTAIVTGTGSVSGTAASELLLGSNILDSMSGGNGSDCLVGGDGNDTIQGGGGTDVCIGGPGTDTFLTCETQIQ